MAEDKGNYNLPGTNAAVITPHDTNELAITPRALWIGGAGNLNVVMQDGTDAILFSGLAAGTWMPIRVKIIKSTSTTATLIIGVW